MIKNVYWSSYKVHLFLSDFKGTLIFSTIIRKNPQISNFMKIGPVGAELFQRTDVTMLVVAFRKFCEHASKHTHIETAGRDALTHLHPLFLERQYFI